MPQKVKYININKLVLWTENPRDRVDPTSTDQDIADRVTEKGTKEKWDLKKLLKSMGKRYDFSELPTVVPVDDSNDKYVVYDGNRRVLIGKIIHKCVKGFDLPEFDFPEEIPCNVCDEEIALEHVERKHTKEGTWGALERDIFRQTYRNETSVFLVLDEATGIISNNPTLNKRFVKDEVFSVGHLKALGIVVEKGVLKTPYKNDDFKAILNKIAELVKGKEITTREQRGNLIPALEQDAVINNIILKNKGKKPQPYIGLQFTRQTRRVKQKKIPLFGKKLSLKSGKTNNLYRDLRDMHSECIKNGYSDHFPMLIRIGLRLLCEVAEVELNPQCTGKYLEKYLKRHFDEIKKEQTKDDREYLDSNDLGDLKQKKMLSLLQKSGHPSSDTITNEKTIALSTIIGKMLEKTHGTKK